MLNLYFREPYSSRDYDIDRLVDAAFRHGYKIDRDDARKAWLAFSESMAAGWMFVQGRDDAELASILFQYCVSL